METTPRTISRKKRSWHDIGAPLEGPSVDTVQKNEMTGMRDWCVKIEAASDIPSDALLQHWQKQWLWLTDPTDECTAKVAFNRTYLYALLFCRGITVAHTSVALESNTISDLLPDHPSVHVHKHVALSALSLRLLKQTIENLHTQWVEAALWKADEIVSLLDRLAHRMGVLLSMHMTDKEIDDDDSYEKIPGFRSMNRLTKSCVRTMLNNIMVLYRSVHIHLQARTPEPSAKPLPTIIKHHVYAGVDDFHGLSMHWDLPPAAVLNYIHQFAGMYNNVSQVQLKQIVSHVQPWLTRAILSHRLHTFATQSTRSAQQMRVWSSRSQLAKRAICTHSHPSCSCTPTYQWSTQMDCWTCTHPSPHRDG